MGKAKLADEVRHELDRTARCVGASWRTAVTLVAVLATACDSGNQATRALERDASGAGEAGSATPPAHDGSSPAPATLDGAVARDDAGASPSVDGAMPSGDGVALLVWNGTLRQAGLAVVLHDSAGEVLGRARTDDDGRLSSTLPTSALTLVAGAVSRGDRLLVSYAGLDRGDRLEVVFPDLHRAWVARYEVGWEGDPPYMTVQIGACSGTGLGEDGTPRMNSATVSVTAACRSQSPRSALAVETMENDMGKRPTGYRSGELPLIEDATRFALTRRHDMRLLAVNTNPPWGRLDAYDAMVFQGYAGYRLLHLPQGRSSGPLYAYPADFGEKLVVNATVQRQGAVSGGTSSRRMDHVWPIPSTPGEASLDLDFRDKLPAIDFIELQQQGSTYAVQWRADGDLTRADYAMLELSWLDPAASANFHWVILLPSSLQRFVLPALPDDVGTVPAAVRIESLRFVDEEHLQGFAELKQRRHALPAELWASEHPLKKALEVPSEMPQGRVESYWTRNADVPLAP